MIKMLALGLLLILLIDILAFGIVILITLGCWAR